MNPRHSAGFGLLVCGTLVLGACPPPPPPDGPCSAAGDPVLMLSNRDGGPELTEGDEVEVFPPPQGGVFTELDVNIDNMAVSELDILRVTIESTAGEELANVGFFSSSLPLRCMESGQLEVDNLPVGLASSVQLTEADGVAVQLRGTLETTMGEFESVYDVVLRATDY